MASISIASFEGGGFDLFSDKRWSHRIERSISNAVVSGRSENTSIFLMSLLSPMRYWGISAASFQDRSAES
jgi:hypothetical protein